MAASRMVVIDPGAGHLVVGVFGVARGGRLRLRRLALESFTADPARDGAWVAVVGEALRKADVRAGWRGVAHVALPGHQVLTKAVKTPKVDAHKREKILAFEAQQAIPFPLEEVVWDHLLIGEDGLDIEVLLAAVKRDLVDDLGRVLVGAGLAARSAVPSAVALYRAFGYNYPEVTAPVIVADIGARSTTLLFIDGGRLAVRTLPLAGNTVTQAMADEGGLDFARAETVKIEALAGRGDPTAVVESARRSAQAFAGRLALEITRSLVNHRRQAGAGQPQVLYLTGGGSLVPELAGLLTERLALRVETFDPLRAVDVGGLEDVGRERRACLATLVGTAVVATGDGASMTLLPREVQAEWVRRGRRPWIVGALLATAAAVAPPLAHERALEMAAVAKSGALEARLIPLQRIQARNTQNLARLDELRGRIVAQEALLRRRAHWVEFLADLQTRLAKVDDVWFDRLQVLPGDDKARGVAVSAGAAAVDAAAGSTAIRRGVRLKIAGRSLDRLNPGSKVSVDALNRVRSLLGGFKDSRFIAGVENERFDTAQPGVLRFDFVLVLKPEAPL